MKREVVLIIFLSFLFTAVTFWKGNFWKVAEIPKPAVFVFDPAARSQLTRLIAADHGNVYVTRVFHNKVLSAGNTFFINFSRVLDLTFLFTITGQTSAYENVGTIKMLYPLEIIVFAVACYAWIIHWKIFWPKYRSVLFFLLGTLFLASVISPTFYLPKFFPYLVMLRIFIYLSVWEWSKKLSSSR